MCRFKGVKSGVFRELVSAQLSADPNKNLAVVDFNDFFS